MKNIRKLLVGLDLGPAGSQLTPGSRRTVDAALWLSKTTGGRVHLLHSSARDEYFDQVSKALSWCTMELQTRVDPHSRPSLTSFDKKA